MDLTKELPLHCSAVSGCHLLGLPLTCLARSQGSSQMETGYRPDWDFSFLFPQGSTSVEPRTAMPSATLRIRLWWRRSSVGWCEAFPPGSPRPLLSPSGHSLALLLSLLSLYLGHFSIDVTCLTYPFQPRPPPCTRAVISRGFCLC